MKQLLALILVSACLGQPTYTQIADTVYTPVSGLPFNGVLQISNQVMTGMSSATIGQWLYSLTVVNGLVSIQLVPNDTAQPVGTTYAFKYTPNRGTPWTQYCTVPTSGSPVKLGPICSLNPPIAPLAVVNLSQLNAGGGANTNVVCLAAGSPAWCATTAGPATAIQTSTLAGLPGTCPVGAVRWVTDATVSGGGSNIYACIGLNTWSQTGYVAGGSGALVFSCSSDPCTGDVNTSVVPLLANVNVWTGSDDFGASPYLIVPKGAGAAPTANGRIAYDTTANKFVGGANGATVNLSGVWGLITGTLANQTDLQTALNAKQASLGFTAENAANKDANSGYAGLTAGGLLKAAELPASAASALGGVNSKDCSASGAVQTIGTDGSITCGSGGGSGPTLTVADRGVWIRNLGSGGGVTAGQVFTTLVPRGECQQNKAPGGLKHTSADIWVSVGAAGKHLLLGVYDPVSGNLIANGGSASISTSSAGDVKITWATPPTFTGQTVCYVLMTEATTLQAGTSDQSTIEALVENDGAGEPQIFTLPVQGSLALPATLASRLADSASGASFGMYVRP